MRFLILIFVLFLGCEDDPVSPTVFCSSADNNDFNSDGDETNTDYYKMMNIVLSEGYSGYVGIEYEGRSLDEMSGIRATKKLLEKVRRSL